MAQLKVYSKKTCVTCQKALAYLDKQGVDYELIPIEQQPPEKEILAQLLDPDNPKASVNTRSAAFKSMGGKLPPTEKLLTEMCKDPNLIKRPVLVKPNGQAVQGFDEVQYKAFLN